MTSRVSSGGALNVAGTITSDVAGCERRRRDGVVGRRGHRSGWFRHSGFRRYGERAVGRQVRMCAALRGWNAECVGRWYRRRTLCFQRRRAECSRQDHQRCHGICRRRRDGVVGRRGQRCECCRYHAFGRRSGRALRRQADLRDGVVRRRAEHLQRRQRRQYRRVQRRQFERGGHHHQQCHGFQRRHRDGVVRRHCQRHDDCRWYAGDHQRRFDRRQGDIRSQQWNAAAGYPPPSAEPSRE